MYSIQEDDSFFIEMKEWMKNNPSEKPTDIWHKVVAWNKGKKLSEEHRKAISETHKKLPKNGNARKGIVFSEEHKQKLKEAAKNRKKTKMSEEQKTKLREISLNQKPIYDVCPHCGWSGLKRVAYRHHFSKCKNKPTLPE